MCLCVVPSHVLFLLRLPSSSSSSYIGICVLCGADQKTITICISRPTHWNLRRNDGSRWHTHYYHYYPACAKPRSCLYGNLAWMFVKTNIYWNRKWTFWELWWNVIWGWQRPVHVEKGSHRCSPETKTSIHTHRWHQSPSPGNLWSWGGN